MVFPTRPFQTGFTVIAGDCSNNQNTLTLEDLPNFLVAKYLSDVQSWEVLLGLSRAEMYTWAIFKIGHSSALRYSTKWYLGITDTELMGMLNQSQSFSQSMSSVLAIFV